jgi:hypothetical protein
MMRKIYTICLLLAVFSSLAFGQDADTSSDVTAGEDSGSSGKPSFLEYLKGLKAGLDLEAKDTSYHNVRYLTATPRAYYEKEAYENFTLYGDLRIPVDILTLDPTATYTWRYRTNGVPEHRAPDGVDTPEYGPYETTIGFGLYLEEGGSYRVPVEKAPGYFDFGVWNRNEFHFSPKWPGTNMVEGRVEPEASFTYQHRNGDIWFGLGVPILYLRYYTADDLGLGLDVNLGYRHPVGFGAEVICTVMFLPDVEYTDTELKIEYDWYAFHAELDVIGYDMFKELEIGLEVHYDMMKHKGLVNPAPLTFKVGFKFEHLLAEEWVEPWRDSTHGEPDTHRVWTFSPMIGFVWNF